jgi:hypothetical protein
LAYIQAKGNTINNRRSKMKTYKIKIAERSGADYATMIITDRATGAEIAEYRLTVGEEYREVAAIRRAIDRHIANGGGLGNYQW